jgi:hypothetical protein
MKIHVHNTYKKPNGILENKRPLNTVLSERLPAALIKHNNLFLTWSIPLWHYVAFEKKTLDEPRIDMRIAFEYGLAYVRLLGTRQIELCRPTLIMDIRTLKIRPLLAARRIGMLHVVKAMLSRSHDAKTIAKTYLAFNSLLDSDKKYSADSFPKTLRIISQLKEEYSRELIDELFWDRNERDQHKYRMEREYYFPSPLMALGLTNSTISSHLMFRLNNWLLHFGLEPVRISQEARKLAAIRDQAEFEALGL